MILLRSADSANRERIIDDAVRCDNISASSRVALLKRPTMPKRITILFEQLKNYECQIARAKLAASSGRLLFLSRAM